MNFGDALKKGLLWGACVGLVLGILIYWALPSITDQNSVFVHIAFVTVLGGCIGCILALIILGIIGTLQLLNWLLCLLAGSLLSVLSIDFYALISNLIADMGGWVWIHNLIAGMLGWGVSIALIPILSLLREYLAEKSPKWIGESIDNAMVVILTNIFITGLTFVFQRVTGITLIGV